MTDEELRELVKAIVTDVVKQVEPPAPVAAPPEPGYGRGPEHRPLPPARNEAVLAHLVTTTPSRIITGRTGTRYLTHSYLGLRADHAIALDAVESEVDEAWAQQQGWLPLRTRRKTTPSSFCTRSRAASSMTPAACVARKKPTRASTFS